MLAPIGIVRKDELLNALIAGWKVGIDALPGISTREDANFLRGFEAGLNYVSQITGVSSQFDELKCEYKGVSRD